MDAIKHIPEIKLAGVQTAGCAMFPGDTMDDAPLIIRDLPIIVISPPWDDLSQAFSDWRHCDLKFGLTITDDSARVRVGLYDPWLNFQVNVPLPDFQDEINQMLEIGWVGIQSEEDPDGCLIIRTSPE